MCKIWFCQLASLLAQPRSYDIEICGSLTPRCVPKLANITKKATTSGIDENQSNVVVQRVMLQQIARLWRQKPTVQAQLGEKQSRKVTQTYVPAGRVSRKVTQSHAKLRKVKNSYAKLRKVTQSYAKLRKVTQI